MDQDERKAKKIKEIDFHGAAIIDKFGREIAITEEMIQEAFRKLEQMTVIPRKATR